MRQSIKQTKSKRVLDKKARKAQRRNIKRLKRGKPEKKYLVEVV